MNAEKPLSDEAEKRMKDYISSNPELIEQFIGQDQTIGKISQCLDTSQKKKFYGLIVAGINLKSMFLPDQSPDQLQDEQIDKITQDVLADPDLGPAIESCNA